MYSPFLFVVIALAASGSLPIITSVLGTAGTALAIGEVGMAASLAGSALSFGAASLTPLAAIAAPVIFFSGISSSLKADENLDRAKASCAEAEEKIEQMKIQETLCNAITDKSDMFLILLNQIDELFSRCAYTMEKVVNRKTGFFKKKISSRDFTQEELDLIAVTRALAGAVKAVIDVPILDKNGQVSYKADKQYQETQMLLPLLQESYDQVLANDFGVRSVPAQLSAPKQNNHAYRNSILQSVAATILGIGSFVLLYVFLNLEFLLSLGVSSVLTIIFIDYKTKNKFFSFVKYASCIGLAVSFSITFWDVCMQILSMRHYLIVSIIIGVILFVIWCLLLSEAGKERINIQTALFKIIGSIILSVIGIVLLSLLYRFIGLSETVSKVIVIVPYALATLVFDITD